MSDDAPVTKRELAAVLEPFLTRADLAALEPYATKADLEAAIAKLRIDLQSDMATVARDAANTVYERFLRDFRVLDDKYRDVPQAVASVRSDLNVHVADTSVHVRASAPKRARRKPKRR